jgi:hypothetical protein
MLHAKDASTHPQTDQCAYSAKELGGPTRHFMSIVACAHSVRIENAFWSERDSVLQ